MAKETMKQMLAGVEYVGKPKLIANNTVQYTRASGQTYVIRLHRTDIIERAEAARWRLNSGGWQTVTTKERLNRFSPARIHSNKGVWYLSDGSVFFDGIEVDDEGRALNPRPGVEAEQKKLGKAINAFVKRLDALEELPQPDSGDCWFCSMFEQEPSREDRARANLGHRSGKAPAERDNSHLLSHIEEGYIHGWLLVNAMRWAGYSDTGISLMLHGQNNFGRTRNKSALRRYLRHRLGLAQ